MELHSANDRIRELSNHFKKSSRVSLAGKSSAHHFKALKGLALLTLGAAISFSANYFCIQMGAQEFDRATWPASKVWNATLSSFGYQLAPLSNSVSLLKNHPDPYATRSSIWMRDDLQVVYLNAPPYGDHQPQIWVHSLYNRQTKSTRFNWIHLTSGVSAFNRLVLELEKLKPVARTKQARNLVDPKEIRY